MDEPRQPKFLTKERGDTDRSLIVEREKTDHSLAEARGKTEGDTDRNLRELRREADQSVESSRRETDLHQDLVVNAFSMRKEPDVRLEDERHRADKAVGQERARVDSAIGQERELKKDLVENLLAQERAQTDQSLYQERDRADSEVQRVTTLLSGEVASHLRTKAALTTRDEFLAIVSHDLRNPVGVIFSCAEMLLEELQSREEKAETVYWIELIKRNALSALRLIDDIMDIERIAEGKLALHIGQHSVPQLLRDSIERFVYVASARSILLRTAHLEDLGSIACDRDRIIQVLSNLIGNALKFTPEGGTVELDAKKIDDRILISVCDTGPGIDENKQKYIFERFAQIGSADRQGLGLGLYISKMLIESHRGQIGVQSTPGKGSTFWISIPQQGPIPDGLSVHK